MTKESGREPETVPPALSERVDDAFPGFRWRRDARGWVATNEPYTHARLGVRAERLRGDARESALTIER